MPNIPISALMNKIQDVYHVSLGEISFVTGFSWQKVTAINRGGVLPPEDFKQALFAEYHIAPEKYQEWEDAYLVALKDGKTLPPAPVFRPKRDVSRGHKAVSALIARKGITMEKLCEMAECSMSHMSKLCSGEFAKKDTVRDWAGRIGKACHLSEGETESLCNDLLYSRKTVNEDLSDISASTRAILLELLSVAKKLEDEDIAVLNRVVKNAKKR